MALDLAKYRELYRSWPREALNAKDSEAWDVLRWSSRRYVRAAIRPLLRQFGPQPKEEAPRLRVPNYLYVLLGKAWEDKSTDADIERFLRAVGMETTAETVSATGARAAITFAPRSDKAYQWQYWPSQDARGWLQKRLRYDATMPELRTDSEAAAQLSGGVDSALEDFLLREEAARVRSPAESEVLDLFHGKGLDIQQIAALRGTRPKTAYAQKKNAERKLRELLERAS